MKGMTDMEERFWSLCSTKNGMSNVEYNGKNKKRKCLRCGCRITSYHKGMRLCGQCNVTNSRISARMVQGHKSILEIKGRVV